MKKKYTCYVVKWLDKVNGNTYHSCRITRHNDGKVIVASFTYGYGNHYEHSAQKAMLQATWLPKKYNDNNFQDFNRENDYPIIYIVSEGLKRECIANGTI